MFRHQRMLDCLRERKCRRVRGLKLTVFHFWQFIRPTTLSRRTSPHEKYQRKRMWSNAGELTQVPQVASNKEV